MSLMYLALNPNISDEQLVELMEKDAERKERLVQSFTQNMESIKGPTQQLHYMQICMPIMIQMMFF